MLILLKKIVFNNFATLALFATCQLCCQLWYKGMQGAVANVLGIYINER